MQEFLFRRLAQTLLALFALSILIFLPVRLVDMWALAPVFHPADYEAYKVPASPVVHYAEYMKDLIRGDWGLSSKWGEPRNVILERLPTTLSLASIALAVSAVVGITLGVLAAINKGTPFDRWSNTVVLLGQSMPIFWLGVILTWVFAVLAGSLPRIDEGEFYPLILPIITLAWLPTMMLAKLTRSAMLSALKSDYVKLARIKGLSEWKIVWKHCLRNIAVSPVISLSFVVGSFLTALILTETVFAWPGIGLLASDSTIALDYFTLNGVVLFLGGGFILCHLAVDVLRAYMDPRIRYSEGASLRVQESARY